MSFRDFGTGQEDDDRQRYKNLFTLEILLFGLVHNTRGFF